MIKKLLTLSFLCLPFWASAFTVTNFRSELAVQPNGDILVTETIKANFTNDRKKHGIFRNIPYQSKTDKGINYTPVSNITVTDENGLDAGLRISESNNNKVLRIGKANQLVDENETYIIKYKIQGVVKNFANENFDQVYWNVTGSQWDTVIEKASAKIKLPKKTTISKAKCFTGGFKSQAQDCIAVGKESFAIFSTNKALHPGEGLTAIYGFDKGLSTANLKFKNEQFNLSEQKDEIIKKIGINPLFLSLGGLLLPLITALYGIMGAWQTKRKLKVDKPIIPKYQVPNNLHPTVVGTVIDGDFDKRDFVAGIIHLATIGAIKIKKEIKESFFGSVQQTSLEKTISDEKILQLSPQDKSLLFQLFGAQNTFNLNRENSRSLYQIFTKIGDEVTLGNNFFVGKSANTTTLKWPKQLGWWVLIPIILGAFFNFIGTLVACVIGFIGITIFSPKRTKEGFTIAYELECYKEFLKTAEVDQLNWASKQEIFEKNLPYAVAFGLEKHWTEKFGNLIQVPNWAPDKTIGTAALVNEISHITSEFESHIQAPQSSSSSGFSSSGGYSGGGSGGGGGSSW
ncbi:hypothetical protein CSB37_00500 [bacterium DOLZORAL124_38_8]|nr:MAG: hypothetical protein CSB37_00500 [bacterium DOLZORAL124_38_8]